MTDSHHDPHLEDEGAFRAKQSMRDFFTRRGMMVRKRMLLAFVAAVVVNLIICWSLALFSDASADDILVHSEAEEQLDFLFGGQYQWRQDEAHRPRGTTHTGRLIRRAYVSGWTMEEPQRRFSELVLKVGWPFTTVRGFVRRKGVQVEYDGCIPLRQNLGEPDEEKILPLQIVWPGFVINSTLLALLFIGLAALVSSRRD